MRDVDETWTVDEVCAAQEVWRISHPEASDKEIVTAPLSRWMQALEKVDKNWAREQFWKYHGEEEKRGALRLLDMIHEMVEKGEGKRLLMLAIYTCVKQDHPIPGWLRKEFIEHYDQVYNLDFTSWDDAFGTPHRKGVHLGRARQRANLARPVFKRVRFLLKSEPDTPIDDGLFDRVADEFGIGRTMCKELYYRQKEYYPYAGNANRPPPLPRKI